MDATTLAQTMLALGFAHEAWGWIPESGRTYNLENILRKR